MKKISKLENLKKHVFEATCYLESIGFKTEVEFKKQSTPYCKNLNYAYITTSGSYLSNGKPFLFFVSDSASHCGRLIFRVKKKFPQKSPIKGL